jgi:phosphopantetheinyl transferase
MVAPVSVLSRSRHSPDGPRPTPSEIAVADGFGTPGRRTEWLHARETARVLVAAVHGLDAGQLEIGALPSGAPTASVPGELSLTHSATATAAAWHPDDAVGVDVCDLADAPRVRRLLPRICTTAEQDWAGRLDDAGLCALWALKEAALKCSGGGLWDPGLRAFTVHGLDPVVLADSALRGWTVPLDGAVLAAVVVSRSGAEPELHLMSERAPR